MGYPGLIVGMANDGIAGVPGRLRISIQDRDGREIIGGSLDPGYPLPTKIRQAKLPLPKGSNWKGLRLKAELLLKGQRYPVEWSCQQKLETDGSLALRPTPGVADN